MGQHLAVFFHTGSPWTIFHPGWAPWTDYLLFIMASLILLPGWPPHTRHIIQYSSSVQDSNCTPDTLFVTHSRFSRPPSRTATAHQTHYLLFIITLLVVRICLPFYRINSQTLLPISSTTILTHFYV